MGIALSILRRHLFALIVLINMTMMGLFLYSMYLSNRTITLHEEDVTAGNKVLLEVFDAYLTYQNALSRGAGGFATDQLARNMDYVLLLLEEVHGHGRVPGNFHKNFCSPLTGQITNLKKVFLDALNNPGGLQSLQMRRLVDGSFFLAVESAQAYRLALEEYARESKSRMRNVNLSIATIALLLFFITMFTLFRERRKLALERNRVTFLSKKDEAILDSAVDAIITTDKSGKIETVNPAAAHLFGYDQTKLIGMNVSSLMPDKDASGHDRYLSHYLQYGRKNIIGVGRQVEARKRDGTTFPIYLSLGEFDINGERHFTAIIHDISNAKKFERKLMEEKEKAEAASKTKSAFLSMVSHELRTPLNGVIGMLSVMRDADLPEVYSRNLNVAFESANSLVHMVSQILDLTKIESSKLELESIQFNLRNLVRDVCNLFSAQARSKHLDIRVELAGSLPDEVVSDPTRLRQILSNLVANAVKFTASGEVKVEVEAVLLSMSDYELRLRVMDTGIGIPPDRLEEIFKPFVQADNTTTRQFGGTGLGLTIVKNLVDFMGGNIAVSSDPGVGTCFTVCLPVKRGLARRCGSAGPEIDLDQVQIGLLCDTGNALPGYVEQCAQLLPNGSLVVGSTDEEQLQNLLAIEQENGFDVLFIYRMNADSSLNFAYKIRQTEALKNKKLVLVADTAVPGHGRNAREIGVSAFLTRPISKSDLYKTLGIILKKNTNEMLTKYDLSDYSPVEGFKVLLVEDDLVNQKVAVAMLNKLGYEVDIVKDGKEGIEAVATGDYPLVLMDCMMPVMDGYEATKRIREMRRDGVPIIIAMTANTLPDDREKCISVGMDDFIGKPLDLDSLARKLSQWVAELTRGKIA